LDEDVGAEETGAEAADRVEELEEEIKKRQHGSRSQNSGVW
jgi:hypothetical protein